MFWKRDKMSLKIGVLLVMGYGGLLGAMKTNPTSFADFLKAGKEYYGSQEYQKAADEYKAAIAAYPDSARGYFYLAEAYWELDQQQDAIDSYQKAIAVDPEYKKPYYELAKCYISMKSYEDALKTYRKLAAILDRNVDVVNLMADVYYLAGNYKRCIKISEQIIDAEPTYYSAYFHIGISYLALGDTSLAREWLKKSKKVSKKQYGVPPFPTPRLLEVLIARAKSDQTLKNILESIVELSEPDMEIFTNDNPDPGFYWLTQKPVETHRVNPKYPRLALRNDIQGTVLVKVLIGASGRVLRAEVMKGDPYLHKESLKAAYQFKFEPGRVNGKPVLVWISIPFNFRLK